MMLARLVPRGTFEYKCGSNVQVHFAINHCYIWFFSYIWLFIVERQLAPQGWHLHSFVLSFAPSRSEPPKFIMETELGGGSKRQAIQERVKRQRKRQTPWKGLRRHGYSQIE
jgi:hypothetical protein